MIRVSVQFSVRVRVSVKVSDIAKKMLKLFQILNMEEFL